MSPAQRSLLATRMRLMADMQAQMAAALFGKGQDELRKHFIDSADLLLEASKIVEQVIA
jgi:hypothetical protein